jgi:hypothetical protein
MALLARGGLWLSSSGNSNALGSLSAARTAGVLDAIASGELRLTSLAGGVHIDAGGVADVLRVAPGAAVVAGSLQASNLAVCDADGAGLCVSQSGGNLAASASLGSDERSLRWRAPATPAAPPGSLAGSNPPGGWDVRAGQDACLRLTRPPSGPATPELAYGLALNARDELQLYRSSGSNGSDGMRVVACFAGARTAAPLPLPLSRNPWV